jgi:hypothetical protein
MDSKRKSENKWVNRSPKNTKIQTEGTLTRDSVQRDRDLEQISTSHIRSIASNEQNSLLRGFLDSAQEGRIKVKELKALLAVPDDKVDNTELDTAVQSLLEQARGVKSRTAAENTIRLTSTCRTMSLQQDVDHYRKLRSELVGEQERLRKEILDLNHRLESLEELRTCLIKSEDVSMEGRTKNKLLQKIKGIHKSLGQAFINLGLKQKLTPDEQVNLNDQGVKKEHKELLTKQSRQIDELEKFELLQLKKPKYVLLLDKLLK